MALSLHDFAGIFLTAYLMDWYSVLQRMTTEGAFKPYYLSTVPGQTPDALSGMEQSWSKERRSGVKPPVARLSGLNALSAFHPHLSVLLTAQFAEPC